MCNRRTIRLCLMTAVCMLLAIGLFGCGKSSTPACEVAIDRIFTCGGYDGDNLVIDYEATNNSKEMLDTALITYNASATVDGTALKAGYGLGSNNPYAIPESAKLPAGETVKGQTTFFIDKNATGELHVSFVSYTLDGKNLVTVCEETIELSEIERLVSQSDYDLKINGTVITDDGDGNDLIVIKTTFTNNSDESKSLGSAFDVKAYQDGIELDTAFLPYRHPMSDDEEFDNKYTDIQTGKSIDAYFTYTLKNTDSPVEFTAVDWMSFDQNMVVDEELDPADAETIDTSSDYSLEVETAVIGYDRYGDDVVVLLMGEFTNNSDEPMSFSIACSYEAAQGGYSMDRNYLSGAYEYNSSDIAPGKSIPVFLSWVLNDGDNDVEIRITDNYHYAHEVLFEKSYSIDELIENTESLEDELVGNNFDAIDDESDIKVS